MRCMFFRPLFGMCLRNGSIQGMCEMMPKALERYHGYHHLRENR